MTNNEKSLFRCISAINELDALKKDILEEMGNVKQIELTTEKYHIAGFWTKKKYKFEIGKDTLLYLIDETIDEARRKIKILEKEQENEIKGEIIL